MSVLKNIIVSLIFVKLFAINLYVPKNFNKKINNAIITTKTYSSLKNINFNNSFVLVSYNDLPFILDKNLTIIAPIGKVNESIFTHEKSLEDIKTIINLDLPSKILLDEINSHYKIVKGTYIDFLNKKVDAIVYSKKIEKKGIFDFPLKEYGLVFNKYFVVTSTNFVKEYSDIIGGFEEIFQEKFDVKPKLVYKTLLISGLYLHKKIDLARILYKDYLLEKEKNEERFVVGVTPNWPPFDMYQKGILYGIGVDFWKLIAKKADIKYDFKIEPSWLKLLNDIKRRRIDLTINTSQTPERKKYAIFSKPYLSFPLAIICRNNEKFNSISDIKSIAVGKNFTAEKLMKKHYPYLNYVETNTVFDALELVEKRKVDCAVDILPVILWSINKNHLMGLRITFKTPFRFDVRIMIRNDYKSLLKKINKAIDKITPLEKQKIINKYLSSIIVQKTKHKYKYVFYISLVIVIIIIFILLQKNKKIEEEAFYDELTNILNRRGILKKVKRVKEGSILFFDIDHFKNINDTYGHEFGDYVLQEMGKILINTFRKSDIIGRWGGEEFIVILPETNYEIALKLAEKLRKNVEMYNFDNIKVTISIGVSEFNGDLKDALEKADEALYEAKRNGRNQVKGSK